MIIRTNLLFFVFSLNILAQVTGISASKLFTYDADVVPTNKIEFEPSVFANFTISQFHAEKNSPTLPQYRTISIQSGIALRFTYGLMKNCEVGFSVPSGIEQIGLGTKIKLPHTLSGIKFALLGGLNLPLGNRTYFLTSVPFSSSEYVAKVDAGVALTKPFTPESSLDFNFVLQKNLISAHSFAFFLSSDFGCYFTKGVQIIIGANYFNFGEKNGESKKSFLIVNPGFTIEKGKTFIIVFSAPYTIFAQNAPHYFGFSFALTTILN